MAVIRWCNVQDLGDGAVLLSYLNQSFISSNEQSSAVRGPERPSNQRAHSSVACGRRSTSFDTLYLASNIIHTRASSRHLGKVYFSTRSLDLSEYSSRYSFCNTEMGSHPITTRRNFLKRFPSNGFVKKSANISSVGQYSSLFFASFSRSLTQKYRISMCLDFCPHESRPLRSILIADVLS